MRKIYSVLIIACLASAAVSCRCGDPVITVEHDDDRAVVTVEGRCRYLMLPVQESSWEVRVRAEEAPADVPFMDIRLAADSIDFYVPFELPKRRGVQKVAFDGLWPGAVCWSNLRTACKVDKTNVETFRPAYHHAPLTGWMNDPNGMVYVDGVYHLYYQHNPYGSKWGNMHWGHSSSRDLVNWEHHDVAIARDTLGHIYSGSAVVDTENCSGFGENAIVAIYTSHNGPVESQCVAYSNDGGMTFTKYEGNPVVTAADGIRDFRDPKVFRYEKEQKWVMVLAANYEVRFYESKNLRDWTYTGCFGKGYGAQPSLFECPDLVRLSVPGNPEISKWVLIVNINPGGVFGGSATQYFTGHFDGKTFICDTPQEKTKWLDYGKDHYAAVTFSNTGERVVAMAWMSNWQYADAVPTRQFRSANSIARDLTLFCSENDCYVASSPVPEMELLRKSLSLSDPSISCGENVAVGAGAAYEMCFHLSAPSDGRQEIVLKNSLGQNVKMIFDFTSSVVSVDRSESGMMSEREDFSTVVSAPLGLCDGSDGYEVRIFVDKASVEIFIDGGRIAFTGLVFPDRPYGEVSFDGTADVTDLNIYEL